MILKKRRPLVLLVALSMVFSLLTLMPVAVKADVPQAVDIRVDQDDLLDLVLTLGATDTDVSTLQADLTQALVTKGVPEDKIQIQAMESSDVAAGDTSVGWEVYDHTNFNNSTVIPYYRPYYAETNGNYSLSNHISVSTGASTTIDFYGYGSPAYKDFMYMPNDQFGTKTFDFTIQEGSFYDALDGAGFLFNTAMSPNTDLANRTMSGYLIFFQYTWSAPPPTVTLYKFTNIDVNAFHNQLSTAIQNGYPGFTKLATFVAGNETTRIVKIEAGSDSLKMWYNTNPVTFSLIGGGTASTVSLPDDFGSYGFGPLVGYLQHGCSRLTHFTFNNITMSMESAKRFSDVIREPEWRDSSKRFIINAKDGVEADFSDPVALGEILTRLGNENIHYLGWGKNAADGEAFILKNGGNGTYIDKLLAATDTYAEQIDALATYVYNEYNDSVVNDTDLLLYGKPSVMTITPDSAKTDTIDADWPSGKWKVDHDPSHFENPTGTALYDGQYLDNLDISFIETGKYEVYYCDTLVKTVYVHRAPVAGFSVAVDGSYVVNITDNAFDPDHQTAAGKGIVSTTWAYRETLSDTWITGQPASFAADKNYIVRQAVTDAEGETGNPYYRFVSTCDDAAAAPVAEFTMSPAKLLTHLTETVSYADTSYDPQGSAITETKWTVFLGNDQIYSGADPMTDFSDEVAGLYKIVLSVKNADNVWSEDVARFMTLVRDTTDPTIVSDTPSDLFDAPAIVKVTMSDEAGGSGFSSRYTVVNQSADIPDVWGSIGTNPVFSVSLANAGDWYIHVKALDYAGNEAIVSFGPFTFTDSHAPSDPTVTATPSYTDGTWATGPVTLTASGSTDDFTADADLVYEYSLDDAAFEEGNSITLSAAGIYTVSFKVTDEASNVITVVRTVKIDMDGNPVIIVENDMSQIAVKAVLNVTVQDGDSGLKTLRTKIGAGDWEVSTLGTDEADPVLEDSFTLMVPFTGTTAADYLVQIEVTDRAGNVETSNISVLPSSVAARILILPDPDTAEDEDVEDSEEDIRDTKRLFDLLTEEEKDSLPDNLRDRFDELLTRMERLLQIISKDETTGVEAEAIGTSVIIPELGQGDVSLVRIELKVEEITEQTKPNFVITADATLLESDREILKSFDISLLKTVTTQNGSSQSGTVSNDDITGLITVRLPLPAEYEGRTNLQVVYIADDGTVTPLVTTLVIVDGQKYLEFSTLHFSTYAIVADIPLAIVDTGESFSPSLFLAMASIGCGLALIGWKKRRMLKKEN